MITYNDFLRITDFPTEEEFNNIINNLPPIENLRSNFEYDPSYDSLSRCLFDYGVLTDFGFTYLDEFDFDSKTVSVGDISDFNELNELNDFLKSYGWTLKNYEEDYENFKKDFENKKIRLFKRRFVESVTR